MRCGHCGREAESGLVRTTVQVFDGMLIERRWVLCNACRGLTVAPAELILPMIVVAPNGDRAPVRPA